MWHHCARQGEDTKEARGLTIDPVLTELTVKEF